MLHPSDYTARIHLVKKEKNNDYHDLIRQFYKNKYWCSIEYFFKFTWETDCKK